jgi:hypothetical protein
MANNSITAANTLGNASGNLTANASDTGGNVSNAIANTSGSGGGTASAWATDFCNAYGDILLYAALAFLLFALLLAVGNGIAALRREWKTTTADAISETDVGDPAKFLDALKGLVDALAKAPAWFAMFLGGALLLWVASGLAGRICVPQEVQRSAIERSNSGSTTANRTSTTTKTGSESAPAANVQTTAPPPGR